MSKTVLKSSDPKRGDTLAALVNQQITIRYSRGVEDYVDQWQGDLKKFVNSEIAQFLGDLARQVFNQYADQRQPRFLRKQGYPPWKPLHRWHVKAKGHANYFYESGDLAHHFISSTQSKGLVSKTLGGYYLKRTESPDQRFSMEPNSGLERVKDLPKSMQKSFPAKKKDPQYLFRKVKIGHFQFSVFRKLTERALPELLIDKIVPPMDRQQNLKGTMESIPASLKLGLYKRHQVKFYRPLLIPYAKHWVKNYLVPTTQKWAQRKAIAEAKK